jgi:hypothetical protein
VDREESRRKWLGRILESDFLIEPLAGDASFRCYFRVRMQDGTSWVLMDAPPEHEDVKPFLAVLGWLQRAGLRVSLLRAEDLELGFLLLEDFGDITWAGKCEQGADMQPLFEDALCQLLMLQKSEPGISLPLFDVDRMQRECSLYLDWYLPKVAGIEPGESQREAFHASLLPLLLELQSLPVVPVHLDYHSRNLMIPADGLPLAVIDFQDAVLGPPTYDLASLLYDCYQDYPEHERVAWSHRFFTELPVSISEAFADADDWHRKLRMTALQRHIKAIGIFARLAYRDGKHQFLDEIPLTRNHLREEMAALSMREEDYPLLIVGT